MTHSAAVRKARHLQAPKNAWQLQTAKAKFSEVFRLVLEKGPQWVTRQGKQAVVILSADQYGFLMRQKRGPDSLIDFFAQSPLAKFAVKLERDKDIGRDIIL